MKKRPFQILDEMNVNDENNKTATAACSFAMVSTGKEKRGGLVTMGVSDEALIKIMNNEYKPMLVLLDYEEYKRLEAIPLADTAQQRIEQLETALEKIKDQAVFPKTENEAGVALYNILKLCEEATI